MGMAALLMCFALAVVPPTGGGALLACPQEVWQLCWQRAARWLFTKNFLGQSLSSQPLLKKFGGNPRLIFLALLSDPRLRFG